MRHTALQMTRWAGQVAHMSVMKSAHTLVGKSPVHPRTGHEGPKGE